MSHSFEVLFGPTAQGFNVNLPSNVRILNNELHPGHWQRRDGPRSSGRLPLCTCE